MTSEANDTIKKLETRVRQLILQDKKLQQECHDLEQMVMEGMAREEALKEQIKTLEQQYANLKTARMLELSDTDTRQARSMLAKLVRDVDKCIALLKAE